MYDRILELRQTIAEMHAKLDASVQELKSLGCRRLSVKQGAVLRMLARGRPYKEIAERLGITQECLHTHCAHIRKKTHIQNTRDPEECRAWLHKLPHTTSNYKEPLPITADQLMCMGQLVMGYSYEKIAKHLGIQPQSVQNHISRGCKRAGITASGHLRTKRIREYLTSRDQASPSDPLADPMF